MSKANGRCFCDDIANAAASHSATLADDQYASLKISVLVHLNDPTCMTGVIARASADLNAARDYYFCAVAAVQSGSNWTVILGKYVNGSLTTLHSESVLFTVNDRIEIECQGTTIRGMKNGKLINSSFSVTDASLASGNAGVTGGANSGPGVVEGDDLDIGDGAADVLPFIDYKSAGAGVSTETSGAALSPLCPATVDAGDILILLTAWEGTSTGPTDPPTDWTKLGASPYDVGSASVVARTWVFGKIADGSEDGAAVALGSPAVTTQRAARIFSFSGRVSGTITDCVPSTSFATLLVGDTDPTGPTVTTTITGSLAIAAVYQHDNNTLETFAGSSDTWTERGTAGGFIFALTPGGNIDLLTATPAADPGTVSGGAMTVVNDPWNVVGFEIRPMALFMPKQLIVNQAVGRSANW